MAETQTRDKIVRSPSYPAMPLREAIAAVGKIEAQYRTSPVDRVAGAKLIGYKSLSGPANQALAALASYGLVDRAGKGEMRVTQRAKAILHPDNNEEKSKNLWDAALEPKLFRELRERFADVEIPPDDGVVSYLNRQGFNQTAIRPAARAFLSTLSYLKEAGVSDSHSHQASDGQKRDAPIDSGRVQPEAAKVGDLIQWESQGVLHLPNPSRVRWVSEDGAWVAVEGSSTGIPMSEVTIQERGAASPPFIPPPALTTPSEEDVGNTTDFRFKVGKGVVVRVSSPEELGVEEINRLVALLQAQAVALS